VDRHRQRREQLAHTLILTRARIGDQIAADEHCVGRGLQPQHGLDRPGECSRRLVIAAADHDVRVAELREDRQTFFTWS
jgi:hypothetical protein